MTNVFLKYQLNNFILLEKPSVIYNSKRLQFFLRKLRSSADIVKSEFIDIIRKEFNTKGYCLMPIF